MVMPPAPVPDESASYAAALRRRLHALDDDLKRLVGMTHELDERLALLAAEQRDELADLRFDLKKLEDELLALMQRTRTIVHAFTDAARRAEYSRLQQRVEAWRGERYISRDEFKKLLRSSL